MPMTTFPVPVEYQKMSVKKAALFADVPRTSFIRKYLETGQISLQKELDGTDFISFDELYRVFGEPITQNLQRHLSGQQIGHTDQDVHGKNEHVHNFLKSSVDRPLDIKTLHDLELQLVRTQGEQARLQALLDEKSRLAEERLSVISEQKDQIRRYFDELQLTRRLLGDKTKRDEPAAAFETQQAKIAGLEQKLESLADSLAMSHPKGFWNRLLSSFKIG